VHRQTNYLTHCPLAGLVELTEGLGSKDLRNQANPLHQSVGQAIRVALVLVLFQPLSGVRHHRCYFLVFHLFLRKVSQLSIFSVLA
jgi:hypothetical protein